MTNRKAEEFGRWRSFFWPVHGYELKKLLPMLFIFFFISFNYNVLRVLKDSLVVTAKSSGAEVIPFIKVWAMFPGAILMTWLFSFFAGRFSREAVFYYMVGIFLGYFLLFACLYPFRDAIHPHAFCDELQHSLPVGFKGFISMVRYWLFTSFYVMSELWSSVILTVLFWGFANQVTRLGEAKRFYGLFGIGANFSGVFAGQASLYLLKHQYNPSLPFGQTAWDQSLYLTLLMLVLSTIVFLVLFRWLNATVLKDPRYYDPSMAQKEGDVKGKVSFKDNFLNLFRSSYLTSIAIIVVAYNIVINLVEVLWKHEVRTLYPNPTDYAMYMNQVSTIIGALATVSALVVSGNMIRKFGWTVTAMITPVILLITSCFFFGFFFMDTMGYGQWLAMLGTNPLVLVVFFGTAQNIMSRGAKYTVFDATKEMSFVPLSPEVKLNGKAAIDGICSRLGKSGGAVIHQTLLLFFSTLTLSAPYVALFLFAAILIWMFAVGNVGKEFQTLAGEGDKNASLAKGELEPASNAA